MADDIVPLGFDVDTSGLAKAKGDAASAGTEISKLGDLIDKLTQVINTQNAQLKQNAQALASVSSATKSAGDSTKAAATDVTGLANALKAVDDTTKKTATDVGALANALKPLDDNAKKAAADMSELLNVQKQAITVSQQHMQQTTGLSAKFDGLAKQLLDLASAHNSAAGATRSVGRAAEEAGGRIGAVQGMIGKFSGVIREMAGVMGLEGGGHGGGGGSLTGALGLAGEGFESLGAVGGASIGVLSGVAVAATAAGAAFLGMQAALAHYQDEMQLMNARLKISTGSQEVADKMFGQIVQSADKAGISIEAFGDQFNRFERIREEMGATTDEVLRFSNTLVELGKISGATPFQIERGVMDLSMGLASGQMDGRVVRQMAHEMPSIGQAIERGNGWNPGSLQAHERNGDITSEAVFQGILKGSDDADAKFKELPTTVDMAFTRLKNDASVAAAELGKITGATTMIQAGINDMDAGMQRFTQSLKSDNSIDALTRQIAALKAAQKADPGSGAVTVERMAQIKQLTAELEKAQKAQSALDSANTKESITARGDAKLNSALNILGETDKYAKQTGELKKQLDAATGALDAMNKGMTSFNGEERWTQNVDKLTSSIARIKLEMEDAAPAAQKMQKAIDDALADRGTYGVGDSKIGASTRKLNDDQTLKGLPPLPPGMADNLFTEQQVSDTLDKKAKATLQAQLELSKMGGIGASGATKAKLDSNADAEQYRFDTFGSGAAAHTKEADEAVKNYRDSLEQVKLAQNSVNDATARFNAQNAYKTAAAGLSVADQGSYAVSLAQQRVRQRTRNAENPGVGDLEMSTWQAQEQTKVREQLADAQRTAQELRDEIANAGSPNSLTAVKSQFAADKIRRSTAPGAAQDALVDDTMNAPQLQQDAKLAEQTAQMERQLVLEQQKAAIYAKGGQDMDEQLAIAQKRYELEQQGITPSNQYYQIQVALAAELAKQTKELEQQKTLAMSFQKVFGDVTKTIGTDLMKTFDTLFTTTGSKTKALMQGIANMAKDVSNTIIEDLIIKPFEQLASQYGSKLLQSFLDSFGSASGSSLMGVNGTSVSSAVSDSTSSIYTPSVSTYSFTANAKGGAYDSPSLSSYSGQVLNKPTFFAFASGAGVAGEAGPEGILPLARGADGSLGVRQYGSGSSSSDSAPSITIVDQRTASGSQPVSTSSGTDSQGQQFIRVLIRDTVKGGMASGDYDTSMKNNFQATRPLTKR